ncbi:MAG: hypothetical protein K8R46_00440 [Pirellulales bacterium]|nr:hypothetical protein [Pirellulales bacterium]
MAIFTGLYTDAPMTYVFGQLVLGLSVYVSLSLLADRPLINPIQAVVGTFYWWFGVGPAVIATRSVLLGTPHAALDAEVSCMEALWVVAPGLLLYAIVARWTLNWFSRTGAYARFLLPAGNNYRPQVIIAYLSLMGFSVAALVVLQWMGIQGREETSFFGGTKTTIWWVGVIAAVGSIAPFVTSALMAALAAPWKTIPWVVWILIGVVVAQTVMFALFGGWKSPIAILGAYFVCAYVSRYQRPPWLIMTVGALVFLVIITPFVSYGRHIAISSGAETSAARKQIFSEVLDDPGAFLPTAIEGMDVSVFFRGIYPLAGELTRRNGPFEGEWHGKTISRGFEAVVPRVFNPNKRDVNIGNFFCQTVGADIGVSGRNDTLNNIAISIPFEFVGNYGVVAGILSFGLIGFLWTLFVVWMLSPARLSNHPLTPYLAISTMGFESAFGHYLAGLRGLIIPLLLCFFIYKMFRGKM